MNYHMEQAFDLATLLNNTCKDFIVSVSAIDSRKARLEMLAKTTKKDFGVTKGEVIFDDNLSWKEAHLFLSGLQWGTLLPSRKRGA